MTLYNKNLFVFKYVNFKVIDKNFIDPTRDDNDKNERMDDVDFNNIYKIEKEAQENETDQFDNINETDNDVTATSIILHVNNIGSIEKAAHSFLFFV